jgi:hypothetical protein
MHSFVNVLLGLSHMAKRPFSKSPHNDIIVFFDCAHLVSEKVKLLMLFFAYRPVLWS